VGSNEQPVVLRYRSLLTFHEEAWSWFCKRLDDYDFGRGAAQEVSHLFVRKSRSYGIFGGQSARSIFLEYVAFAIPPMFYVCGIKHFLFAYPQM
jgi:hypothetical protein